MAGVDRKIFAGRKPSKEIEELRKEWTREFEERIRQPRGVFERILRTPIHVKSSIAKNFSKIDLRPRLLQIQVPTLVIIGEKDVICPIEEATHLAQRLPKARLEVIPEAGHCLPLEKPYEFNAKVISFLREDS